MPKLLELLLRCLIFCDSKVLKHAYPWSLLTGLQTDYRESISIGNSSIDNRLIKISGGPEAQGSPKTLVEDV